MERIDKEVSRFMREKKRYPEYLLISPAIYEELKSYLGLGVSEFITSYKDISLYVYQGPDPMQHIVLV